MRERDKKGYPQFVGRIIAWKSKDYRNSKVFYVRVAGFDYHVGFTFVNADNNKDNYTCYNGPLSPNGMTTRCDYDKAFEYALKVLRTNSLFNVDEIERISEDTSGYSEFSKLSACAFGV